MPVVDTRVVACNHTLPDGVEDDAMRVLALTRTGGLMAHASRSPISVNSTSIYMVHRDAPHPSPVTCWHCAALVDGRRLRAESVLHSRTQEEGGPYSAWTCTCGIECGVLHDGAGSWLLYPLEGYDDPGLLDRLAPRVSRAAQDTAVLWWKRHRARVERFRQRAAAARGPTQRSRAQSQQRTSARERRRPAPEPQPRRTPPPRRDPVPPAIEQRSAHELLGVAPGAAADEIRKAYRKALKLCHPDRVANLDPEIQDVAHRKAKALRRAYEDLLGAR